MQASRNGSIQFLPVEIIRKILFLLPNSDLKNATSVCKRWQYFGSESKLWRLWGWYRRWWSAKGWMKLVLQIVRTGRIPKSHKLSGSYFCKINQYNLVFLNPCICILYLLRKEAVWTKCKLRKPLMTIIMFSVWCI